ncbi:hypothetical protein P154DRAFT_527437 [Amniculicola lignicola CBS 123094]|uniref:CENP-V/GFA domain-containing protein n=1 Tax=Amniculicola lignicola CBS 123094 TaxID=1392246 RepID=A0A6A5VZ22_9PLEO|nr:hypothetical protein P154DRAFT_527437 [Amniculicola lignicola CBS 123094]
MAPETTTLTATCHCKSSTISFTVPTDTLGHLKTHFCHCDICRHTHGTLCTIHTPILEPTFNPESFTAYESSSHVTRWFCSTCGAHMVDRAMSASKDGEAAKQSWCVATSLVDADESIWAFDAHIFVGSTRDGGLATWLPGIGNKELKIWTKDRQNGDEDRGDWMQPLLSRRSSPSLGHGHGHAKGSTNEEEDKLHLKCHCGGIDLSISRPSSPSSFAPLPPSLIPANKRKWLACNDVCTTCRLVSGVAIVSWFFPATSHITLTDGSPYRPEFGTAKVYRSSGDVTRTFCGRCGATVAYACDDRPGMVDLGVGLVVVEGDEGEKGEGGASGVRAEEWLEWRTGKCSWEKDCRWKGVLKGFKEGMVGWSEG